MSNAAHQFIEDFELLSQDDQREVQTEILRRKHEKPESSKRIKSVSDFIKSINELNNTHQNSRIILYRGQTNSEWKLKTSLERIGCEKISCKEYYQWIDKIKPLINPFINEKWQRESKSGIGYPSVTLNSYDSGSFELPEMEYMAYLRHHGFPTPILDWSRSAYVALFFACEDFPTSETDGKVFIYADRTSQILGNNIPYLRRIGHYLEADKRHFAQKSEYLLPSIFDSEWHFISASGVLGNFSSQYLIEELVIDRFSKSAIIKELHTMLINRHSLYLDEDNLIKHLSDEFFIEKVMKNKSAI
ncbi:FRG domain-containing protein [Methylomagnum sp.]